MLQARNNIVEVLGLVGGVHNCHQLEENDEIVDHYDCRADIKKAIELLQTIDQELEEASRT